MYYTVTKEEINNIMGMPGEVSGEVLQNDKRFIIKKGGRRKVVEAEEEMSDYGHSFSYNKIKKKAFYPWGKRVLSLLAISNIFKMEQSMIKNLGKNSVIMPPWVKFKIRYFSSTEQVLENFARNWRKNNTVGRVEIKKIDKEKKQVVVVLYNLDFHPIFCDYFCGYLAKMVEISEGRSVSCQEEKCYFSGDCDFHQFVVKW